MGAAVNDPYGRTPVAAFPVSLNVQACASLDTSCEEIVEPVASRWFARSAFGYGHELEARAIEAATFVVTVVQPELAPAVPLPPQPATKQPRRDKHGHTEGSVTSGLGGSCTPFEGVREKRWVLEHREVSARKLDPVEAE